MTTEAEPTSTSQDTQTLQEASRPAALRRPLESSPDDLPLTHRQRLNDDVEVEEKRTLEIEDPTSTKYQRISAVVTSDFSEVSVPLFDNKVSAVTTPKTELEVPVAVIEDENELLLMKAFQNPELWYETTSPRDLEVEGMKREMQSMMDFRVFEEVPDSKLTEEQLSSAISTPGVKVRKHDGSVGCRLVVRGEDQVVEDLDDTFASTPSLTTLKLLLTLAVAFGWKISTLDISTAFLHAMVTGEDILPSLHLSSILKVEYFGSSVVHFTDWGMRHDCGRITLRV